MGKIVAKEAVQVKLDQTGVEALQKKLDMPRKPRSRQIRQYFQELVDEEIGRLIEDYEADKPEEDDEYSADSDDE